MPGFVMYKGEMIPIEQMEAMIADSTNSITRKDGYNTPHMGKVDPAAPRAEAPAPAPVPTPEEELPGKPEQTGDSDDSGDSDGQDDKDDA